EVLELEAVQPDGQVVSHAANDVRKLRIDVMPEVEALRVRPMKIYLAVVTRARSTTERYSAGAGEALCDENTGDCMVDVSVLRPTPRLFLGEEPPAKYVYFPLAEVRHDNNAFTLTSFQPPWLRVMPGNAIHAIVVQIATRLR